MTSKKIFFNVMKEDLKGKMAILLLSCFGMLFCFPIVIGLNLESIERYMKFETMSRKEALEELSYLVSRQNSSTMFMVFCFALVIAFSQFGYLYKKKQVDFYHSLPVNRGKYFLARYISGVLLFFVPFVLFTMSGVGMISASGFGNIDLIKTAVLGIVTHTVGFLMFYSLATLAICMTGNLFTGICGAIIFHGYGTVLGTIIEVLMTRYSETYISISRGKSFVNMSEYLTPVWIYSKFVGKQFKGWLWYAVGVTVVLIILSFLAFSKRKSETAGKSIAFALSKPVIKVCIIVLVVCTGTMVFYELGNSFMWEIIGFLLSLVISHILIQIIYELDVKAVVKGRWSFLVSAVISLAMFGGFYLGGNLYDKGNFNWEQMESVAIYPGEAYGDFAGFNMFNPNTNSYINREQLVYDKMKFTDFDLVKDFVKTCYEDKGRSQEVLVQFTFKNGSKKYRRYYVSNEVISKYMPKFVENKEFREGINQVFLMDASYADGICYHVDREGGYTDREMLLLRREEVKKVIDTYKEEYLNASLAQINEEAPIYQLEILMGDIELATMIVYPSMEKTLEILQGAGLPKDPYENCEVTKIEINYYNIQYNEKGEIEGEIETKYVEYEDEVKKAELMDRLAFGDLGCYTNFDGDYSLRREYHVVVRMKNEFGMEIENRGIFTDDVPEWLIEDLEKAEAVIEE